jgi:hypothetical protein
MHVEDLTPETETEIYFRPFTMGVSWAFHAH